MASSKDAVGAVAFGSESVDAASSDDLVNRRGVRDSEAGDNGGVSVVNTVHSAATQSDQHPSFVELAGASRIATAYFAVLGVLHLVAVPTAGLGKAPPSQGGHWAWLYASFVCLMMGTWNGRLLACGRPRNERAFIEDVALGVLFLISTLCYLFVLWLVHFKASVMEAVDNTFNLGIVHDQRRHRHFCRRTIQRVSRQGVFLTLVAWAVWNYRALYFLFERGCVVL